MLSSFDCPIEGVNHYIIHVITRRTKLVTLHVGSQHLATSPNISISLAELVCFDDACCLQTLPLMWNRYLTVCNFHKILDLRKIKYLQLQPLVVTAPLHSPCWKQYSMKPMIQASIGRAERSTTHVDVKLTEAATTQYSHQKSNLVRKIQCHRLYHWAQRPPLVNDGSFFA